MNYIIKGEGVLINESGDKTRLKEGDFALVDPNERHQYRNRSKEEPLILICAVPKEYE
jgi:quercetin dioxygenase-like cupin family protein